MSSFKTLLLGGVSLVKSIAEAVSKRETKDDPIVDPLDVELPEKKAHPLPTVGGNILVNDLPSCMGCHRTMVLNGTGIQKSELGTPVEVMVLFCAKCGKTAILLAHAKFDRTDPKSKPSLGTTVFWGDPLKKREINTRLRKLEKDLSDYDKVKKQQKNQYLG